MADDRELDLYHGRANHEDNLHVSRTSVFLNFNGFIAVAVGIAKETWLMLLFSLTAFLIDLVWALWASDASTFIRGLRDHGGGRADEQLWQRQRKDRRWRPSPLVLMSVLLPWFLVLVWLAIFVTLSWPWVSQHLATPGLFVDSARTFR